MIVLTRKELVAAHACKEGLALFDRVVRKPPRALKVTIVRGAIRAEWSQKHTVWLLKKAPRFETWLVSKALVPRSNLRGANLERANLAGANLERANLAGAYLAGAYLAGANLAGANLAGANLAGAYLAGANLAGADLGGADLGGAYRGRSPAPAGWHVTASGYLERAAT